MGYTLIICLSQHLVSKVRNKFSLRNKITIPFFGNPHDFYLPTHEKFAPPYTSPDLAQNFSSDRL